MKGLKVAAILAGVVSVIAIAVLLLAVFVFSGASDAEDRAEVFLEHLKAERYEIAFSSTTRSFQAVRTTDTFTAEVQDTGLHRHENMTWYDRRSTGEGVVLFGRARLDTGDTIYVRIAMASGQVWRVDELSVGDGARPDGREGDPEGDGTANSRGDETPGDETPGDERAEEDAGDATERDTAEAETDGSGPAYPDSEARDQLVLETLLSFNEAVRSHDFTEFHQRLSRPFREQHQPSEIQAAFQSFIDRSVDIGPIRGTAPVYDETGDPGQVRETGRLTLAGHFPTVPARTGFSLSYVWEENAWRLIRIRVRVDGETPDGETEE